MTSTVGILLLRLALFLLPAVKSWLEGILKAPPPPSIDPVLHETVSNMLPVKSASAEAAEKIKAKKAAEAAEKAAQNGEPRSS